MSSNLRIEPECHSLRFKCSELERADYCKPLRGSDKHSNKSRRMYAYKVDTFKHTVNRSMRVWPIEFLKKPQLPDTEEDHVSRVGRSANGNFLIGGSRYASVWNAATQKPLHTFNYQHTYTPSMSGFATSPDSRRIAITDGNRAIFFFDLASGQAIGKIDTEHTVAHPCYFPDGTRLLTFDDRLEGVVWSSMSRT